MTMNGRIGRTAVAGVAAAIGSAALAVAAVPKHASYEGKTSQHKPVAVQVSHKGKRVDFQIEWVAACEDGETLAARTATKPSDRIKPDRKGRFHFKSTAHGTLPGYGKVSGRNEIHGRVTKKRATGWFKQFVHFKHGKKRVDCATGKVTWRAPRKKSG